MPGWDTHGLPIEQALTKKALIAKMSVAEFREKCKEFALKQIDIQRKILSALVYVVILLILTLH